MCGIAGRLNLDSDPVSCKKSAEMIRLMRHRRPEWQDLPFIDIYYREESNCPY